ncbi:uncharacterized protein CPUR_03913 [Claviceps purpurea 20.1]|uniref:ATP-dependent DNA helicase n=1 Tax=Claviceps purpurea (strain 20.1) TaxID=1111077 RepID=M1W5S3_CLAP2|nr:uncharacterized protein CPUR_03913 [Claviceps purpurea 20.1]
MDEERLAGASSAINLVMAPVDYESQLNSEQRAVWEIFKTHCHQLAQALQEGGPMPPPLEAPAMERAAPTGIAANAIDGQTIHSLLKLPVSRSESLPPLEASQLANVRAALAKVHYIILDEKSMIGLRTLRQIRATPNDDGW